MITLGLAIFAVAKLVKKTFNMITQLMTVIAVMIGILGSINCCLRLSNDSILRNFVARLTHEGYLIY